MYVDNVTDLRLTADWGLDKGVAAGPTSSSRLRQLDWGAVGMGWLRRHAEHHSKGQCNNHDSVC